MLRRLVVSGAALALSVFAPLSYGSTLGVTISGGSAFGPTSVDTVIGWRFTANQNIVVDSLGMWDEGGNGFTADAEVGLWNTSGTLLGSAVVTSSDLLIGGFRFAPVAGIALAAGSDYVVAGLLQAPDSYRTSVTVTNSSGVIWVDSRAVNSPTLTFPTGFVGTSGSWFGANLTYNAYSVPEPTTLALLGLGLAGLGLSRRRNVA